MTEITRGLRPRTSSVVYAFVEALVYALV